jgi:hypothetical protein
VQAVHSFQKDT